ncbi:aldo/keto reductase [Arsenicitalea aurantiaca]|uniref:Aldo/keto reductase n=1 Tax=Arsenicitalea aurantiaca TaxID=1783274 RepID=A0A433XLN8_9HYPH|nr:aldo/keto reductase [Arsenicitalea aurantiaca]RUT35006.1 aldo/keto reductase [Arsenicitalea aurantiaca]
MAQHKNVTLNDGVVIPQIGFGVWQVPDSEVEDAVSLALESGYRSIDTAQGYQNEAGVGRAIGKAELGREEIFVTSKLRNREQGFDSALRAFEGTMEKLGLETLDLFLIHWPVPSLGKYVESWKALVRLKEEGRVRSIGVSNFLPEHLERIIGETGVTPSVNQIEVHPYYQQRAVRDLHKDLAIAIESYSPLGSGAVIGDETVDAIARKHDKTPAQVIIRWHLQEGLIVIPKSVTPSRIRENIGVFDFSLEDDDMSAIRTLDDPAEGKTGSDPAKMAVMF